MSERFYKLRQITTALAITVGSTAVTVSAASGSPRPSKTPVGSELVDCASVPYITGTPEYISPQTETELTTLGKENNTYACDTANALAGIAVKSFYHHPSYIRFQTDNSEGFSFTWNNNRNNSWGEDDFGSTPSGAPDFHSIQGVMVARETHGTTTSTTVDINQSGGSTTYGLSVWGSTHNRPLSVLYDSTSPPQYSWTINGSETRADQNQIDFYYISDAVQRGKKAYEDGLAAITDSTSWLLAHQ